MWWWHWSVPGGGGGEYIVLCGGGVLSSLNGGDCSRSILEFPDLSSWHNLDQDVLYGTTSLVFGEGALLGHDHHLHYVRDFVDKWPTSPICACLVLAYGDLFEPDLSVRSQVGTGLPSYLLLRAAAILPSFKRSLLQKAPSYQPPILLLWLRGVANLVTKDRKAKQKLSLPKHAVWFPTIS